MTEIEFSIYGDQASPFEEPFSLLPEFKSQHQVDVRVSRMAWDEAWPKLLGWALHGGGPDISQIGSIWTSTLVSMGALRPFGLHEISAVGGQDAFFPSTWQNAQFSADSDVWAVPFTAFTYFVLYRRDVLARAGIAEPAAFGSAGAMAETLERLRAAGVDSPVIMPSGKPFRARAHVIASWVWGAGGDFLSADGQRVLFDQPQARAGVEAFFELYRGMSPSDRNLTYDECIRRFAAGRAAVTLASSSLPAVIGSWQDRQVLDNIGVAVMPGVPWVGGSNIVVWKKTQRDRERAALGLASFLASRSTQEKYAAARHAMPARSDALRNLHYDPPALDSLLEQSVRTGRSYQPTLIWVRMLDDLRKTFDGMTAEVLDKPDLSVRQIASKHLDPVAKRFTLLLSR